MYRWKRKVLGVVLLTLCIVFSIPGVYAAPEASELDLKVEAGYDGVAKVASFVPFRVTLSGSEADISGEVQVIIQINERERNMYAVPFSLQKGSSKRIEINVPVTTANRKVEVKAVKEKKILARAEYSFKKLIPPESPVIGILTEDANSLRELSGIVISDNPALGLSGEAAQKMKALRASGFAYPTQQAADTNDPVESVRLDAGNFPDKSAALSAFDILVISNFDSGTLSEQQVKTLTEWVADGHMLFLGTGLNWSKVTSGLPEALRPFKFNEVKTLNDSGSIAAFAGDSKLEGAIHAAVGNPGDGKILLEADGIPLATAYRYGSGTVTVLAFDPTFHPFAGWKGSTELWKELIQSVNHHSNLSSLTFTGNSLLSPVSYLANNVPESQTPPFNVLMIIIVIYVLLVGPILYYILKWKDRRDWNWVVIPVAAFIFMAVVYFAGFKTRFETAVLNSISAVHLDSRNGRMEFDTVVAAFNNKSGTLQLQYDRGLDLQANVDFDYFSRISNLQDREEDIPVTARYSMGEPAVCELYNTDIWIPKTFNLRKTAPLQGTFISDASFSDGKLKVLLHNQTSMALKEAFLILGTSYIEVGDLLPGQKQSIDISLTDPEIQQNLEAFLIQRYQQYTGRPGVVSDAVQRENNRKHDILSNFINNSIYSVSSSDLFVTLIALNEDDPGYQLKVNGKQPKMYNTNIIYSKMALNFGKDMAVEIPEGMLQPVVTVGEGTFDYFYDQVKNWMRFYQDTSVDFRFVLPQDLDVQECTLRWNKLMPYDNSNTPWSSENSVQPGNMKFYIYNWNTSDFEETGMEKHIAAVTGDYIDPVEGIRVRVVFSMDGAQNDNILEFPKLALKGVAR